MVDVVEEFMRLTDIIREAQAARRSLVDGLPVGRTEGCEFDLYHPPRSINRRISMELLRRYVPEATIKMCTICVSHPGTPRIVNKKKPKKSKKGV